MSANATPEIPSNHDRTLIVFLREHYIPLELDALQTTLPSLKRQKGRLLPLHPAASLFLPHPLQDMLLRVSVEQRECNTQLPAKHSTLEPIQTITLGKLVSGLQKRQATDHVTECSSIQKQRKLNIKNSSHCQPFSTFSGIWPLRRSSQVPEPTSFIKQGHNTLSIISVS